MNVQTLPPAPAVQEFRNAMATLASTVTVVAARRGAARRGRKVTAAFSLGIAPPSVLVSIAQGSDLALAIHDAGGFSFSMLAADQADIAETFAGGRAFFDRFAEGWGEWASGNPRPQGALATMDCRLADAMVTSGHTLFVGEVVELDQALGAQPLVWHDRGFTTV